jgi:hypothetical protein
MEKNVKTSGTTLILTIKKSQIIMQGLTPTFQFGI